MASPERKAIDVTVRQRRQMTLPRELCDVLGIQPGDRLEIAVEGDILVGRPKKRLALEALKEIQDAFARSGMTEAELQAAGRRVRRQLARERYGTKA
jgi:AbrB family looped-hinge helix DNA binding protein